MIVATGLGLVLFFEVGLELVAATAAAIAPAAPPPTPLGTHEARTATAEEISAATAELPELWRRAEAALRPREETRP